MVCVKSLWSEFLVSFIWLLLSAKLVMLRKDSCVPHSYTVKLVDRRCADVPQAGSYVTTYLGETIAPHVNVNKCDVVFVLRLD